VLIAKEPFVMDFSRTKEKGRSVVNGPRYFSFIAAAYAAARSRMLVWQPGGRVQNQLACLATLIEVK